MSLFSNNPSSHTLCDWVGANWKSHWGILLRIIDRFPGLLFSRVTLSPRRCKWRARKGFRNALSITSCVALNDCSIRGLASECAFRTRRGRPGGGCSAPLTGSSDQWHGKPAEMLSVREKAV